jgi:ankyrin repeat protein
LHLLCDFGGSLEALRILLEFQETRDTIHLLDGVFHRRPLEILNARKNRSEFQTAMEKMRRARQRQQALMREVDQGVLLLSQVQDDLDALDDTVETYHSSLFWKKLALLIYAEHTGEAPLTRENEDGTPELVVSGPEIFLASVANPNCPVVLQEFSILLHHNLLLTALDDQGNLPLHIAALSGNPSVIASLVNANPLAASVHNRDGNLPFAVWLQRSDRSSMPLHLLEACPSALTDQDYDPRYYPHIWSQLTTPAAIFESLRSQPDLLLSIQINRAEI